MLAISAGDLNRISRGNLTKLYYVLFLADMKKMLHQHQIFQWIVHCQQTSQHLLMSQKHMLNRKLHYFYQWVGKFSRKKAKLNIECLGVQFQIKAAALPFHIWNWQNSHVCNANGDITGSAPPKKSFISNSYFFMENSNPTVFRLPF